MAISIKYEGTRDSAGYHVHFHDGPDSYDHEGEPVFPDRTGDYSIGPEGGAALSVLIDDLDDPVFEQIAQLDPLRHSDVVSFTNDYGFLVQPQKAGELEFEVINTGVLMVRSILVAASQKDWRQFERDVTSLLNKRWSEVAPPRTIEVRRVPGKDRPPQTFEVARDLFTFSALQISVAVGDGAEVKACVHCQNLFAVGPNTNRKRDAIYCSSRCRVAEHRAGKE